jgi:hypothetical protein
MVGGGRHAKQESFLERKKERKKKARKKEVFAIVVNCQHGLTETRTGIEKSAPAKAPHHVAAGAASQQ